MITQLRLFQLRNFISFENKFDPCHVVLYGPNGSGKTTILEAVSLFSPGKGLCNAASEEIITQHSEDKRWYAQITWDDQHNLPIQAVTGYNFEKKSRIHKLQEHPVRNLSELQKQFQTIWLTPEYDRLFLDSPSKRRRFLDRLVPCSTHYDSVLRFEHLAKERLKVLRTTSDPSWLNILETNMHDLALFIMKNRENLLNSLVHHDHKVVPFSAHFSDTRYEDFKEQLQNTRRHDTECGRTSARGPHNIDWTLYLEKRPAYMCSTGEQKKLLLSFFLAFVNSRQPNHRLVVLLDDIFAHLDKQNCDILCYHINNWKNLQVWIATTDKSHISSLQVPHYYVNHSTVERM